jgi:hypothetical protein
MEKAPFTFCILHFEFLINMSNNNILWKYAGMGAQILVSLGLALFIGLKLDAWLRTPFPLLVWLLPLLVIIGMIIKTIKDTSKPKHDK